MTIHEELIASEPAKSAGGPRCGWGAALLLCAFAAAALYAVASASTLWDRDEPRFAQATVEMLRAGDFLVPTFNGRLRPDKPVLIYWLMALPVRLLGPVDLAFRCWSPVAIAATLLLAYAAGKLFFSPRTGLLAAGLLAMTPLVLIQGSAATTDAVLLAFVTLAVVTFAHAFLQGWKAVHGVLLAVAFAGGLLTKGPVGLVVPLGSIAAIFALGRRETPLRGRHLVWACAAALVGSGLFLLWAIPANQATAGEFARRGLGHHVLERIAQPLESHGGSWLAFLPYYLAVVLLTFFPWTGLLPGAVSAVLGGRLGGRKGLALLAGWTLPTFALMTLVATKLPHYILPIWPGLALAAAATLEAAEAGRLTDRDRLWLRRGWWLIAAPGLALGSGLIAGPYLLPGTGLRAPGAAAGVVTLAMTVLALSRHHAGRFRASCAVLAVGCLLVGLILRAGILPAAERLKVSPALAAAVRLRAPGLPVAVLGDAEPSLVFYLRRDRVQELRGAREAAGWMQGSRPGVLICSPHDLDALRQTPGARPVEVLAAARGFNFTKGRPVELVAVRKTL